MIQRERVADNVYFFQSEVYAQVTAGAVIGPEWAVVIDTLAFPDEALNIRDFIEDELEVPVRYVINTHYHADHSWGTCYFPGAIVLSHARCRELLKTLGVHSLDEARKRNNSFRNSQIILPHMTFDKGNLSIKIGKKTLTMMHFPGHSEDGTGVFIEEDRVLFSGDVFMPLPYIVDGNYDDMVASLKSISKMGLENVVQGHGDVVLRGEIEGSARDHLSYLSHIRRIVRQSHRRKYPADMLTNVGVESCGKGRVLIGGLAEDLHQRNLVALYKELYGEIPAASEVFYEEY